LTTTSRPHPICARARRQGREAAWEAEAAVRRANRTAQQLSLSLRRAAPPAAGSNVTAANANATVTNTTANATVTNTAAPAVAAVHATADGGVSATGNSTAASPVHPAHAWVHPFPHNGIGIGISNDIAPSAANASGDGNHSHPSHPSHLRMYGDPSFPLRDPRLHLHLHLPATDADADETRETNPHAWAAATTRVSDFAWMTPPRQVVYCLCLPYLGPYFALSRPLSNLDFAWMTPPRQVLVPAVL